MTHILCKEVNRNRYGFTIILKKLQNRCFVSVQAEDELSVSGTAAASTSVHDFLSSRNLNSSPDLGIESDQGRFSSLEHQDHRALVPRESYS